MTQLEALQEIANRESNGDFRKIPPGAVVEAARPENSPLHGAFCWDDTKAAKKYRIIQAQNLIRSFYTELEIGKQKLEAPMFVNLSIDRKGRSENNPFRLVKDIVNCPDLMAVAVKDALEQLNGLKKRYSYLKQLQDVWNAIDSHNKS